MDWTRFRSSNLNSFDSFRRENSTAFAYAPFVSMEPRNGHTDEKMGSHEGKNEEGGSTEFAAENNSFLTEV
ncbi:hypothetical protein ACHAWX_000874 [Stephanocyclus meneghinianus]